MAKGPDPLDIEVVQIIDSLFLNQTVSDKVDDNTLLDLNLLGNYLLPNTIKEIESPPLPNILAEADDFYWGENLDGFTLAFVYKVL